MWGALFRMLRDMDVALQAYRDVLVAVLKRVTDSRAESKVEPTSLDSRAELEELPYAASTAGRCTGSSRIGQCTIAAKIPSATPSHQTTS